MALAVHMPVYGCEHLDKEAIDKINKFRKSSTHDANAEVVQYRCLNCSVSGGFPILDKHFSKSKHDFAISPYSVYCGRCNDLVYDYNFHESTTTKKRKLAQISDEDESYLTTNTSQRPCGREGVRGLFNLGETCYMNAVLQMMVHNPLLSSYFLGSGHPVHTCPISREPEKKNESDSEDEDGGGDEKPEAKTCVACGMTEVFSDAAMADQPLPAHAVNLLFASWKNIQHMSGKGQQDAQEWFMLIVDKLHEAVKQATDHKGRCQCFFHKIFFGRTYSEITCNSCHTVSGTEEEYSSLSLDFKKQAKKKKKQQPDVKSAIPNVHECLKGYTAPESQTDYKCQTCDTPQTATKRVRIRKLPAILCVHVKRFGMKISGGVFMQEKYEGKIDFPLSMDMAPYTTIPPSTRKSKYVYDLDCVVVHQGENAHNGHYFAFCRQGTKWYRFDDEIVSATTTEDVMRQEAYLLFYSLRVLSER